MTNIHDIDDVIRLHDSILVGEFGGFPGVQDVKLLASALARPFTGSADGTEYYPTIEHKAAILLQCLIQYHPFIDGNKRSGVAITELFLREKGFRWKFGQDEIVEFALSIADNKSNTDQIIIWIRERIEPLG